MLNKWRIVMGLFSRSKVEEETGFNVITLSGTAPTVEGDEEVITAEFPTTFEGGEFEPEDYELANRLREASREELLGSAFLYLAAAENADDSNADYATIAMAYIAMAATRPATPIDV